MPHIPRAAFWRDKRVFVTGHSGFKGGWLSVWLQALGAHVHGYALDPPTTPSLFKVADVARGLESSTIADIRDFDRLRAVLRDVEPEIVFHLAAQPLVRDSYARPVDTYAVNVMGVVHLLEALRSTPSVKAIVNVTTDKCYENHEGTSAYGEADRVGGHDPYSSSKACAELVTSTYRRSFLAAAGVAVATARAGNVIGGGDWAVDRLVPDVLRAVDSGHELVIRSPHAIRPWQHVLEPVSGYLALAERLHESGEAFAEPWNFGPVEDDARAVEWIVDYIAGRYARLRWRRDVSPGPHEANYLRLDSRKARGRLGWASRWRLHEALDKTLEWHTAWRAGDDMRATTVRQIDAYLGSGETAAHVAV